MLVPHLLVLVALVFLPTALSTMDIRIVFSDLDGTLIHYDKNERNQHQGREKAVVSLPASSTGMVGTISRETYSLCRNIRSKGCKLIFVSGMRFSTLMGRLPYLPKADYYACDNGGRIFRANADLGSKYVIPKDPLDEPFYLEEDMEWRRRMEAIVGADGYDELGDTPSSGLLPMKDRTGVLWECVQRLQQKGIVVDSASYATCVRINKKHNSGELFEQLANDGLEGLDESLTTSVNLGCIDIVPKRSGKKNCCQFLAERIISANVAALLKNHCICLCDDDNDIEMALACGHAFLPSVASDSMRETIMAHPKQCTVANGADHALQLALELIDSQPEPNRLIDESAYESVP